MLRQRKRRARRPFARQPRFEFLESRRVLTSIALWEGDANFDATPDTFVVEQDSQSKDLEVLANDRHWWNYCCRLMYVDDSASIGSTDDQPTVPLDKPRITIVSTPQHGTAIAADDAQRVLYTPHAGFVGVDQFRYTLLDRDGHTSSADVYVNVVRSFVAIEDWFVVTPGSDAASLDVLKNDRANAAQLTLPELKIVQVQSTDNGVVAIADDGQRVSYRPGEGFTGLDEFQYVIQDEAGHRSEARVRVRVAPTPESGSAMWLDQREQYLLEKALAQNQWQFGQPKFVNRHFDFAYASAQLQFMSLDAAGLAASDANRVSRTNVQVTGVDEGDIVKADGDYLYILSNRTVDGRNYQQLIIVDTHDATYPFVVSRVDFQGHVLDEFVFENRLFVISTDGVLREGAEEPGYADDFAVTIFDISDHVRPRVLHETFVEGHYSESRSIGEFVYLISNQSLVDSRLPQVQTICLSDGHGCFYETADAYITRVRNQIDELAQGNGAPRFVTHGPDGSILRNGTVSQAPLNFIPNSADSLYYSAATTSVVAFHGLGDTVGPVSGVSITNEPISVVYASRESIYLVGDGASGRFDDGIWRPPQSDIHKFSLTSDGTVNWVASATIDGHVHNQFSLDEHDGYLRVVTGNMWGWGTNQLFILEQQGDKLNIVGRVDDLAPGERIYSARFMGDRGFVVTFRRIDPLFAMDLSDPLHPQVLGELKTPGYSQYLQLIDDKHLLGIGRNANENSGLFQEMQVSLFDVTDLTAPQLLHRYSFEGVRNTWSPVMADAWNLGEHHALNYFPNQQVLAIPFYEGNGDGWSWAQAGAVTDNFVRLLKIDPGVGITSLGQVDFDGRFDPRAARTVLIENSLYAISPDTIKVVDVLDPGRQEVILYIGRGATDDHAATRQNTSLSIELVANDDVRGLTDAAPKIVSIGEARNGGQVTVADEGESVMYTPPPNFVGTDTFTYLVQVADGIRSQAQVTVDVKHQWHNPVNRFDTDGDGTVAPLDLLILINFINRHGMGNIDDLERSVITETRQNEWPFARGRFDVDNDEFISVLDVLAIVNSINARLRSNAAAESAPQAAAATTVDAVLADADSLFEWDESHSNSLLAGP